MMSNDLTQQEALAITADLHFRNENARIIFLDNNSRPFQLTTWGEDNQPWLFRWHKDNHWVSLRPLTKKDARKLPEMLFAALPDDQAKHYDDLHQKWEKQYERD